MKLKCVIVDDEPLSVDVLVGFLRKIQDVEVVATFNDAVSALGFIRETELDFLLLDIEMPQLSGIDIIRSLSNPPLVIITSANKTYALEGYELEVFDYLVKPITFSRLVRAINRVVEIKQIRLQQKLQCTAEGSIFLRENKKMVRVNIADILYIESDRDYAKVVTSVRTIITKHNISFFEQELNPKDFIRVHRSFIVSIKRIDAFSSSSVEIGKVEIPFGRLYKEDAHRRLESAFDIKKY